MLHSVHNLLAANPIPLGDFRGLGILGNQNGPALDQNSASSLFENILSISIGVMTVVAAIWFLFTFIGGTIQWLASGGDKAAVQAAQKRIVNSVIGLFLVVAAYGLTILIGGVLGLNITNPAAIIVSTLHP